MRGQHKSDFLLLFAFFLTGISALGYEILWTRLLSLVLGNESLGVQGVLTGFFAGLALGAIVLNKRIKQSQNPLYVFIVLEVLIAVYASISPHLFNWLVDAVPPFIGPIIANNSNVLGLTISILFSSFILLPATFCMGATLVALTEARKRVFPDQKQGKGLGRLYAVNTLGASIGVLITIYFLLPLFGFVWTAVILAAMSIISVVIAYIWSKKVEEKPNNTIEKLQLQHATWNKNEKVQNMLLWLVFGTGLCALGLETSAVHLMSLVLENTVYTFANILVIYLIGIVIGSWLYQFFLDRLHNYSYDTILQGSFLVLILSYVPVAHSIFNGSELVQSFSPAGSSYFEHVSVEFIYALSVLILPSIAMGFNFSHLIGAFEKEGIGRAYALNTLGSACAPIIFGLFGITFLGFANAFYLVLIAYILLYLAYLVYTFPKVKNIGAILLTGLLVLLVCPHNQTLIETAPGWRKLAEEDGLMGKVIVSEQIGSQSPWGGPIRRLQINKHFKMGGGNSFAEMRMGHLPLLLSPNARNALYLGVGTGVTLGASKQYHLDFIEAVEIVPEVIDLMHWFDPINGNLSDDHSIKILPADARRFVAANSKLYDLVVADLFHPARDGAGNLYAEEHFRHIKERLAEGGKFVQWVPLHQFDPEAFKILVRTFLKVFPESHGFIGLYNANTPIFAIVGCKEVPLSLDAQTLYSNINNYSLAGSVFKDPIDLMASYFGPAEALIDYAGEGAINTDLNPVILFHSPKSTYTTMNDSSYLTLESILPFRKIYNLDITKDNGTLSRQSISTWNAVGHYLSGEILLAKSMDRLSLLNALNAYIKSYQMEPNFSPALGKLILLCRQDQSLKSKVLPILSINHKERFSASINQN